MFSEVAMQKEFKGSILRVSRAELQEKYRFTHKMPVEEVTSSNHRQAKDYFF